MVGGTLVNMPFSGGVWEQSNVLLDLIAVARRAWVVFKYMPANDIKWKPADADFIDWVNNG
jgi:hypothetical protein